MRAEAKIDPGTCGLVATVIAEVEGARLASFTLVSECDHVRELAAGLAETGPFDVYEEMDPSKESQLRVTMREGLKGSYAWCPVPLGMMKAMQVAAGLGLPDEMSLRVGRADEKGAAGARAEHVD